MKRIPHPVRGAYDLAREDIPCPSCGAEPFVWCRQDDGRVRHVPCVARLVKPEDPRREAY